MFPLIPDATGIGIDHGTEHRQGPRDSLLIAYPHLLTADVHLWLLDGWAGIRALLVACGMVR